MPRTSLVLAYSAPLPHAFTMVRQNFLRPLIFFSAVFYLAAAGNSQDLPAPQKPGLAVAHVGNSHSHYLRLLTPLAVQAGHAGHSQGEINILGAPLRWNWDHGEQNKWPTVLAPTNKWDAITLLAWDNQDDEYAVKFATEVFKGNPQCQVFIYTIWPDAAMDFEKPQPIRTEEHTEKVAAAVAAAFPQSPKPRVIPSSLLIRELGRLADRGELPKVGTRFELFTDGGHLGAFGQYADIVMVNAMLYNESPLAYPADIYGKNSDGSEARGIWKSLTIPPETAEVMKRVVWDILLTYPPGGMDGGLVVAQRSLAPVIAGQPYKSEMTTLHATGKCSWSVSKGSLPAGITLSNGGVLAGQSTATGEYPVTIKVSDEKGTFERRLVLSVHANEPPVIPDQALPSTSLDQYVFQPLKAAGGVGHITWSVVDGKLPYGVMLTPGGILLGNPGEPGQCTFKIKAEDSFPGGPRAAEKSFTWTIGPSSPESLVVKRAGTKDVTVDGKLDESLWSLDQPITKKVKGAPVKKALFNAVWSVRDDKNQEIGSALVLAIKVLDGSRGKTPLDGVHFFIDGRHNKEVIYNADDTHFFVAREQKAEQARAVRGKPNWFTKAKVTEIEGGYVMEVSLSANYFLGEGNWLNFGNRGVYGFDIIVDEGDKEADQQAWRGDANDAEDTSHFGTIVLISEPATSAGPSK